MSYLLDNAVPAAGSRLEALAAVFDPSTFRHLDALGIAAGWRCWEVGAGGPSVTRWLANRVGPSGRVVATDLDVAWAREAAAANVDVIRHDVGAEPPPGEFDLVHARLVLVHVIDRDVALRSMIASLRPGGWLVIEDADPTLQPLVCLETRDDDQALANRLKQDFRGLLAERGADLAYGRTLPRLLREAGLVGVGADAYFAIVHPALAALERFTIEHIRGRLVASGRASDADIERHLANLDRLDLATSPMITAWGRKGP